MVQYQQVAYLSLSEIGHRDAESTWDLIRASDQPDTLRYEAVTPYCEKKPGPDRGGISLAQLLIRCSVPQGEHGKTQ
jgi:hypothetical protein